MKILIIGGKGYIGTQLIDYLLTIHPEIKITSLDLYTYSNKITEKNKVTYIVGKYQSMSPSFFKDYSDIILLAGQSSVFNSKNIRNVIENNIKNFGWLLDILNNDQKLIYASSSSVYGNTEGTVAVENVTLSSPYNLYDWSKQSIDNLALLNPKKVYGLRFGTVNGFSRNLRNDIMINSMVYNGIKHGKIYVANHHLNRPILGMNDLCNAMYTILLKGTNENTGIYNLSSFNSNVDVISECVSRKLQIPRDTILSNYHFDNKTNYDFKISSDKFTNTFQFEFKDTIDSITDDLLEHWEQIQHIENRNVDYFIPYKIVNQCRVCDSETNSLIDFGLQPLANKYCNGRDTKEEFYPLHLHLCNHCFHTQINCVINPNNLFKDYIYVSGTSKTLRNNFKEFAEGVITKFLKRYEEKKCIKVLEIACNDGSQLDEFINYKNKYLGDYNIITVGVDPAENIYEQISSKKEHDIYCEFFSQNTVDKLKEKYGEFDIIIAANVFAHIDYPSDFLKYMKQIMSDRTSLYIQTSQKNMILENQFDTIYHEHLSFFNTNSIKHICDRNGLYLNHVQENYIHGTSYIFEINSYLSDERNVEEVLEAETKLYDLDTYEKYKLKCMKYKMELNNKIIEYKLNKQNIIAYGSTAKSMTVFNFCGIDSSWIDTMIDENPMKVGLYTPGSKILVTVLDSLNTIQDNTVIIITAWNFYDEIKTKILNHLDKVKLTDKVKQITLLNINSLEEEIINL